VLQAIEIDDNTAVLIRNKRDGQQKLITKKELFIPSPDEEIIEVQQLNKLADYEACIVRGKDGTDTFCFGKNPEQRYSVYLLYSYKSTNTDTWGAAWQGLFPAAAFADRRSAVEQRPQARSARTENQVSMRASNAGTKIYLSLGARRCNLDSTCSKFDLRPMFMSFEFNCRTSDNVELILEGTFFWEINDVQSMFKSTGDVC